MKNEVRYEIDKKDEEFPTGVYLSYMTEGNRKSDEVRHRRFFASGKRSKIRDRQERRGVPDGSVLAVHDQGKPQV